MHVLCSKILKNTFPKDIHIFLIITMGTMSALVCCVHTGEIVAEVIALYVPTHCCKYCLLLKDHHF
jgi:hypothetical protein